METGNVVLLESYERILGEVETPHWEDLLDRVVSRMSRAGLSLEDEILRALEVVRTHFYNAHAMRSFAAEIISSSAGGGLSSEELAAQALDIAKSIYSETHRAVTLKDIDAHMSRNPAFVRSRELVKSAEELASRFSEEATYVQDFNSIKRGMKEETETSILSFLSALARKLDDPKIRRRTLALIGMEISKLPYLRKVVLGRRKPVHSVSLEAGDLGDAEKIVALRGLSLGMGEAGKVTGENGFILDSLDLAEVIDDGFLKSWTFQDLGKLLGGSDVAKYAFERAIEGAREIEDATLQVLTLTSMVGDYLSVAGESQARPFMDYLQEVTEGIEDEEDRALSLTNTISAIGRTGSDEDQLAIERTLMLAGGNKEGEVKVRLLSSITENLMKVVNREDVSTRDALVATVTAASTPSIPSPAMEPGGEELPQERTPLTGIVSAGLKGLHRNMKNMMVRLRNLRDVDRDHVAFLLRGALGAAEKQAREAGIALDPAEEKNITVSRWLTRYGICGKENSQGLPLLYPLYENLRVVEARVAHLQAHETLLIKRYVRFKETISVMQDHITEYEKAIGDNPRIYNLETTFLKLLGKEEAAIKKLLPSLEREVGEHWKTARQFLLEYRRRPGNNLGARMKDSLETMNRNHGKCLEVINEHTRKLANLKEIVEKIDIEIETAVKEFDSSGKRPGKASRKSPRKSSDRSPETPFKKPSKKPFRKPPGTPPEDPPETPP